MKRFRKRGRGVKRRKGFSLELVAEEPVISICIPSDDHVDAAFCLSLVHLLMHTMLSEKLSIKGITVQHVGASILPHSRYTLVKQSFRHNATHLLFLDSDMTFPPDTLVRLMRHDKDIVGINAMSRRPPYNTTAWIRPNERVVTLHESTGLEKAWRTGFAVVLIKASVFAKLDPPYFAIEYIPERDEFRGEDYVFFDRARAAGCELYIDHDLSKEVNHIGQFAFNPLLKQAEARFHEEGLGAAPLKEATRGTVEPSG
jgi:hypothetical protein